MNLPRFHARPEELVKSTVRLDSLEKKHLRARRVRLGDRISIFDGQGGEVRAELVEFGRDHALAKVRARLTPFPDPPVKVHLWLGLVRWSRFRIAVEKAVELGASSIYPMITERSQPIKGPLRPRLEGLVIESLKQCRRSKGPDIHEPVEPADLISKMDRLEMGLVLDPTGKPLAELFPAGFDRPLTLVVGPEGGLTKAEVGFLTNAGFRLWSLSQAVLRTETAALAALALAMDRGFEVD